MCEAGYIEKTARFDERKNGGQTSNLYTLSEIEIAPCEVAEETDNAATVTEDAPNAEISVKIEYSYTFSEGLKRIINQATESVSDGWTGGQFNFIPP